MWVVLAADGCSALPSSASSILCSLLLFQVCDAPKRHPLAHIRVLSDGSETPTVWSVFVESVTE